MPAHQEDWRPLSEGDVFNRAESRIPRTVINDSCKDAIVERVKRLFELADLGHYECSPPCGDEGLTGVGGVNLPR